jgi:hypothetical protein
MCWIRWWPMLHERTAWIIRIKDIEREYQTIETILNIQFDNWHGLHLQYEHVSKGDIHQCRVQLEPTYLVRLFAEFESGLRSYWHTISIRKPRTEHLCNSVGSRCRVENELLHGVHAVREYRNYIVHENFLPKQPITMSQARSWLCQYFARLPVSWA